MVKSAYPRESRPVKERWSDVDGTGETDVYAKYLDAIRQMDSAFGYKSDALAMLRVKPGAHVLDAGCGTGDDAKRIAEYVGASGRVVGIDNSATMIEEATRRWTSPVLPLSFHVGDVHKLEFEDESFDRTRADRVFQHLTDPDGALAEFVRVLRPGGRVAISDPDWGTFIVDGPDTDKMRIFLDYCQRQAHNSWIGRRLYGMFRRAGLVDIETTAHTIFCLDYEAFDRLGHLETGFNSALEAKKLTPEDVADLRATMSAAHQGGQFCASMAVFTVAGSKPR